MSERKLTWDTINEQIVPSIKLYLENIKEKFENENFSVSEIGKVDSLGTIGRDIVVEFNNRTVIIRFEVVDSTEYEGEMNGYNVKLSAVCQDGTILVKRIPENYTDSVWTMDIEVLRERVQNMQPVTKSDLET